MEYMQIDGLMVSADDVKGSGITHMKDALDLDGPIIIDSGGFRPLSLRLLH